MVVGRTFTYFLVISCIALTAVTAKSKYYDGETRPYEFGYRIEGNQHRHEKKDVNGIINGEFGFITGDGAYHQSVYATDENGNFKLISLKTSFRTEKSTTTAPPATAVSSKPASHSSQLLKMLKSCSSCRVLEKDFYDKSIPTATDTLVSNTKGEVISTQNLKTDSGNNGKNLSIGIEVVPTMIAKSNNGIADSISPINIALGVSSAGIRASEQMEFVQKEQKPLDRLGKANTDYESSAKVNSPSAINAFQPILLKPNEGAEQNNKKAQNEITSHQISKPVTSVEVVIPVSLQTKSEISVPISTDGNIHTKSTKSSKTHLSSKQAINEFIGDVLYRFNYTAAYHGHNEEGDSEGNKRGSYFIIGRDNIRRGVIYVANSNGFVPVVKYEKVRSEVAPREDTEKSAGLRGYEFRWFNKSKSEIDHPT